MDNANAQRWVKFKIQEIIFQANSPLTLKHKCNSNWTSFTTSQRAPQNAGYPVFPHSVEPLANNTTLRERQMYESPQSLGFSARLKLGNDRATITNNQQNLYICVCS